MNRRAVEDDLRLIHQRRVRIGHQSPRFGQSLTDASACRQLDQAGIAHAAAYEDQ